MLHMYVNIIEVHFYATEQDFDQYPSICGHACGRNLSQLHADPVVVTVKLHSSWTWYCDKNV